MLMSTIRIKGSAIQREEEREQSRESGVGGGIKVLPAAKALPSEKAKGLNNQLSLYPRDFSVRKEEAREGKNETSASL